MPTQRGSCHCGRIRFEADGELIGLSVCNCSICRRTGYVHWTIPPERFRLLAGADAYATYEFGTRVAKHHFCRTCGISPFRVARSDPDQIDVQMDRGILTIKGERSSESTTETERFSRVERRYGSFHRRFALPDSADAEGIAASGRNGVLEITIPKKPESAPRRIRVGNQSVQSAPRRWAGASAIGDRRGRIPARSRSL